MWTNYHARLHQTLKHRCLLPKNSKILIAVSGGQDSLCLARLCLDLQLKWDWDMAIAHYDHGWALDEGLTCHIEKITENWGLNFYLAKAKQKIPETEADARKYRYEALINMANNHQFNYLVTGHTLSDRSETFIYNLIRGAGMEGLSALNWTRKLTQAQNFSPQNPKLGGVKLSSPRNLEVKGDKCTNTDTNHLTLVRPLLNFTRIDTLAFCQQLHLPIWEDKYNDNKKFARNRIRLDLIPYIKRSFNPQIEQHLAQTAEILRADVEYLTQEAEKILNLAITEDKNSLKRSPLSEKPLSMQRRVVKIFLAQKLGITPNFEQIEAVVSLITAPNLSRTSSLSKGRFAQVRGDIIVI
jgi:tRNA(Ile)-lysidine synthase